MKKTFLFLFFLLMSIGVHSETVVTNKVYTFGSSSTPTGWTLSRTSGHASGYLKLYPNDYLQMSTATVFTYGEVLSSDNMKVEVSCGTYGSWSGSKSVLCTVELRKTDGTILSTANATFTSLNNSEGTYRAAINVSKPTDSSLISYLRITFSNFNSNSGGDACLRVKNVRLNYKTNSAILPTYKVYLNNCGSYIDTLEQENYGDNVTLPNISPSHECVLNGWQFIGWSGNSNDHIHLNSGDFTPTKDTTLYAIYKILNDGDIEYVTDTISYDFIGNSVGSGTATYHDFSNKKQTSNAIYQGNTSGGWTSSNNPPGPTIQIRVGDGASKRAGIVTSQSGGSLYKVKVIWNSKSENATHSVWIYESDTVIDPLNAMFVGSHEHKTIPYSNSGGEVNLDGGEHIGIRSNSGTIYIDSIYITWAVSGGITYEYSSNPLCFATDINVAEWFKDSVKFDIGDYDSIHTYRGNLVSCDNIRIELTRNDSSCVRWFQVPIFAGANTVVDNSDCDVVILKDSILTISDDISNNNVFVYPTGTLSIPSGKTYTVNSLTLRRDNDSVPHLSYKGTLDIKNGMFFELRTDADDWRWITLPDTFSASDIRIEPEILLGYYDGEYRAQHGRGAWKNPSDDREFMPGEGFIYGINIDGTEKRNYKYEIDTAVLKTENGNKIVPVSDYGYDMLPLPPANDLGWNIVANPYMDIYESDIASNIKVGSLVREPGEPWNGKWIVDPESETKNLRYIVVRSYEDDSDIIAAGHYKSILLSDGYRLEPFSSFFIQAAEGVSALIFDKDNTVNRAPSRRSNVDDRETFLRVNVGNRQTGCFISNKFTDEYEVGDDLESMYPIYQLIGGYKLLYSAINDSIINSGVKVYTPSGNLHLDSKTNLNEFDEIYALYNDTWYDLLHGETVDVSGEFILQARRKAHNDTPTGIEETDTENTFNKILYNGNVYILKNNCIFNMLGERIR